MRFSLLTFALLALCAVTARAGCYRGRPRPPPPTLEASHWHWTPADVPKRIPAEFTWADVKGRSLITPSWNQHQPVYCGSCFAHATLSMLSDRLKIEKGGLSPDVMLSRQSFLNCAPPKNFSGGCNGGDVIDVLRYMREYGLPDETCLTYTATDSTKWGPDVPACPPSGFCTNCMPVDGADTCWAVKTPIVYKTASYGKVGRKGAPAAANARAMQAEILQRGPIVCSIATPDDFTYGYRGGVYVDPANYTRDDVDHDIEVVGWGVEDGTAENGNTATPYWIVRNSWGSFWGENGFIRVPRGSNALYIEDGDCWGATVDWSMERDVRSGKLVGTMWGVVPADDGAGVTSHLVKAAWA